MVGAWLLSIGTSCLITLRVIVIQSAKRRAHSEKNDCSDLSELSYALRYALRAMRYKPKSAIDNPNCADSITPFVSLRTNLF
jgi:hypothetical protein